jgi:hypothetical protein
MAVTSERSSLRAVSTLGAVSEVRSSLAAEREDSAVWSSLLLVVRKELDLLLQTSDQGSGVLVAKDTLCMGGQQGLLIEGVVQDLVGARSEAWRPSGKREEAVVRRPGIFFVFHHLKRKFLQLYFFVFHRR